MFFLFNCCELFNNVDTLKKQSAFAEKFHHIMFDLPGFYFCYAQKLIHGEIVTTVVIQQYNRGTWHE